MAVSAITWALEFMWDGISWTDETAYCNQFDIDRGRDNDLGLHRVGSMTLVLRNDDGRFTPRYTSSPLYPNVKPKVPVRLKSTHNAVTVTQFTGKVGVPGASPADSGIEIDSASRQVVFKCSDGGMDLVDSNLNLGLAANKLSSDRVSAILTEVNWSGGSTIATGIQTLQYPRWRHVPAWDALQECAVSELGGVFFVAKDGKAIFQDRQYRARQSSVYTFTNMLDVRETQGISQIFDQAVLQYTPYTVGTPGVVWSRVPLPFQLAAGEQVFIDENYPAPATSVSNPIAVTDWTANDNADGSGTDRTASVSMTGFVNYGDGAKFFLTNNHTAAVWITRLQIRGTPLYAPSDLRTVQRTASGAVAPFRTYSYDFRLLDNADGSVGNYADYIVLHMNGSTPLLRASTVERLDDNITAQMLNRELSDRITVVDTLNADGSAAPWKTQANEDYFIEHIRLSWDGETTTTTVEWLLTHYGADQAWILGTSALDIDTILGF